MSVQAAAEVHHLAYCEHSRAAKQVTVEGKTEEDYVVNRFPNGPLIANTTAFHVKKVWSIAQWCNKQNTGRLDAI